MKENLLGDDFNMNNKEQQENIKYINPSLNDTGIHENINTLNEPITYTLKRDLIRIWNKLRIVIFPKSDQQKEKELRHWDLWGPFLFCISLAFILMITEKKSAANVLTTIFILIWSGACIITINTTLLGGEM